MSISLVAKLGLAAVLVGTAVNYKGTPDTVTQTEFLERLAARVERANALSPQARAVVSHVVERSLAEPERSRKAAKLETRRQLAITRLENALQSLPEAE